MSCSSCSSAGGGFPRGCRNNGTCGNDSCNKLTVFDWLDNMQPPSGEKGHRIVEVRFKNSRKEFFRFPESLQPQTGNLVITNAARGYDLGTVSLSGPLVFMQMKRKKIKPDSDKIGKILRLANQEEINLWQQSRAKEVEVQKRSRELAIALNLEMKLSDVEFQGDGTKATFYYTADQCVDFRQLIKDMARAFSIRIEMRQIGLRQEASRLGGIGSCGRELCCSTWLTDFRTVSTAAARYQRLCLNPQKLSGQCGRLKCCLNFELEAYREAIKAFPNPEIKLQTEKGIGIFQKMDIFKGVIWYAYKNDWFAWHKLSLDSVNSIIKKNRAKEKVSSLEAFAEVRSKSKDSFFDSAAAEESIKRFDEFKTKEKRIKKRKFEKRHKRRS